MLTQLEGFSLIIKYNYNSRDLALYLSASQLPAVRPGSASAMAAVSYTTKVIAVYLQSCYTDEGLSIVP